MRIDRDKQGQSMIEWDVYDGNWRRAWVLHRGMKDEEKDYAQTGRYLDTYA